MSPSPYTHKNKQNPFDMAPSQNPQGKSVKPKRPLHKPVPSSPVWPSSPPLPTLSLLGCSPDAWRRGDWH